jgi:gamma-glutamylputrescine oxidase
MTHPAHTAAATDTTGRSLWDDGFATALPTLASDVDADLCVVGLGGSGLSCVREAQRLGASVVGLDAGRVGGGAAGRNGGFLLAGLATFHHAVVARVGRDVARELYELTVLELARMQAETPALVSREGSLRIASSPDELRDCATQLAAMRADDLAVETYAGPEGDGLLFPLDGSFQPLARCRLLAARALAAGARLHESTAALQIGRGMVRTAYGRVRCRHVVVAVDGGLERLLPELEGRVRSARLQMLATSPADDVRIPRPVYARWGYDFWQQRPDGAIALGGGRDLAGEGEWTTDATPTLVVQQHLEGLLRHKIGSGAPITHRWGAIVGFTDDGLPVCAEVRPGVWAIGGYSGTGNVIGALLGRGLARRTLAGDRSIVGAFQRPGSAWS